MLQFLTRVRRRIFRALGIVLPPPPLTEAQFATIAHVEATQPPLPCNPRPSGKQPG